MGVFYPQEGSSVFTGRVGTTVGYLWKGKACLRAYNRHINYPNTTDQQQQRNWFIGMVRFASTATNALRLGLKQAAAEAQMTEGNYFVMMNKRHFSRKGEDILINYSQLQLSVGPAADVYFKAPRFLENEGVEVTFEKNTMSFRASGDDKIYLYAYAPDLGEGYLAAPANRRSKVLKATLPEHWTGTEVHLYGFVVDKEGRASNTTYIGIGRVNHYEERGRYIPLNKNWNDFVEIANEANAAEVSPAADLHSREDLEKPVIDLFSDPPEVP